MINLSPRFKELYNTYGGKSVQLVFYKKDQPGTVDFIITDDLIHTDTLEITESLCTDENLNFGACESAKLEIVVSANRYTRALYPHNGLYPHTGLYPVDNLAGREFELVITFF